MSGKPAFVRDLEQLRHHLMIEPFDRVRVIVGRDEQQLALNLECAACELFLDWRDSEGWWVCPGCGQEVTEKEGEGLMRGCHELFRGVVGENGKGKLGREGKGLGRWLRAGTEILKR